MNDALLIQGRLRRHGQRVTIREAQRLRKKFGRCYPTRFGLNADGLRECERMRSIYRRGGFPGRMTAFEIRLLVYEERKYRLPSSQQPVPYAKSAANLREWWRTRRAA